MFQIRWDITEWSVKDSIWVLKMTRPDNFDSIVLIHMHTTSISKGQTFDILSVVKNLGCET